MAPDFALPQSSWGELKKIIHAYCLTDQRAKGEPVSITDVASALNGDRTLVSRNNKFLASIGVIEGGQRKQLTPLGRELGLAISHEDEGRIREVLGQIVANSDSLSRIVDAVRVRSGMDSAALQTHIGITAGAPRSPRTLTGSGAVIQMLIDSGRLVDDGGTIRAAERIPTAASAPAGPDDDAHQGREATTSLPPETGEFVSRVLRATQRTSASGLPVYYLQPLHGHPGVTININITVNSDDIDAIVALVTRLTGETGERGSTSGEG